jgi:S1-C subfamily serine protease
MAAKWHTFAVILLLALSQPATKNKWIETVKRIKHSIVPVACGYVDERGKWNVADIEGSGFFVDRSGRFVTAKHVLDGLDAFAKTKHHCIPAIYIPDGGWGNTDVTKTIPLEYFNIAECRRVASADLAVCQLKENPFTSPRLPAGSVQEVSFDTTEIPDGTPIAFSGFPLQDSTPVTSIGSIAGRAVLDGSGFFYMIDKIAWPGASGSPVYTEDGKVVGIMLRSGTDIATGISYARGSATMVGILRRTAAADEQKPRDKR